ncbi:hypothetical protein [Pseudoduganella namucuonensis]|uniref:Uncharacterized protein n=1 Tax=Pseudoduganella namucuonensis TaxID=1035707 RepID=A0A1I7JA19_9BURK|nr:hypothetical protein [Pseudoduganella namucuonensis]SFU81998.1 hypothetical protein SAMN05216552_1010193 [Pseudoduganella namucuonensis]
MLDAIEPIVMRRNRFKCDHGWDIDLDDGASNYVIKENLMNSILVDPEGVEQINQKVLCISEFCELIVQEQPAKLRAQSRAMLLCTGRSGVSAVGL